ncbi:hypothetical protein HOG98_03240 [bacterium]|jgi:hypothetical protein|nr:hypothetical protein [bacterium]
MSTIKEKNEGFLHLNSRFKNIYLPLINILLCLGIAFLSGCTKVIVKYISPDDIISNTASYGNVDINVTYNTSKKVVSNSFKSPRNFSTETVIVDSAILLLQRIGDIDIYQNYEMDVTLNETNAEISKTVDEMVVGTWVAYVFIYDSDGVMTWDGESDEFDILNGITTSITLEMNKLEAATNFSATIPLD